MAELHFVIVILPSGNIKQKYNVGNLEVLKDDMSFLYPSINIDHLITKGHTTLNKLKFLYHKFEW